MSNNKLCREPDSIRWTLDKNNNPIQVKVWTSSSYRHGSDWDYDHCVEDMNGRRIARMDSEWDSSWYYEVFGYDSPQEALNYRKKKLEDEIMRLENQIEEIRRLIKTIPLQ